MDALVTFIIIACVLAAAPALIEGAVSLVALAFRMVTGTAGFALRTSLQSSMRSERHMALAKASYGAFLLYVVAFEWDLLEQWLPDDWSDIARLGIGGLGIVWLLMGFGQRARGDRKGELIFGYLVKIGIGVALIWMIEELPYDWLEEPARLLAMWLLITGVVKLGLVLRGLPREPDPVLIDEAAHGNAGFTTTRRK